MSKSFWLSGMSVLFLSTTAVSTVGFVGQASAATFGYDVFLISDQSEPDNNETAPFLVKPTKTYKLNIDPTTKVATSKSEVIPPFYFNVEQQLTYKDHRAGDYINVGEPLGSQTFAERIDSEAGIWDDVGIVGDGRPDREENIDFESWGWVKFNGVKDGFTDLIIAEDAGLDPFKLYLCDDVNPCNMIFNGFSDDLKAELAAMSDFSISDTSTPSNMDQAFLFRFDEKIFDHVGIKATRGYGHTNLEVDFVGTGHMAPVPVPAGLPMFLTSVGAFAWFRRRKQA